MASSVQYITKLMTTNMKLNKKCRRYETIQYCVLNFNHKQLSSKHMNFIPAFLFPILHIHLVFFYPCVRNRTLKAELEHQVYRLLYMCLC